VTFTVLPLAAAVIAGSMVLLWALSLMLRDVSIVDPAWGPLFVVLAVCGLLTGHAEPAVRWLLLAMTAAWGLRLGAHLARRKLAESGEDRRYARMRKRRGSFAFALHSLLSVFLLQGLLVLVVSLPVWVADGRTTRLGAGALAGIAVWAVGFAFEAVGDEQLRRFKRDPGNRGRVMDRGLWRYTRHPNYFGDACVWWGLWLVGLSAGGPWWTLAGPVVMTVLLVKGSGAALLERDIAERRPEYRRYIERTSGFVPLPPRDRPVRSARPEA
jgi:steroid 5-alpha reductase family enzyme